MLFVMFCARPGYAYVSVPKIRADRLLQLPHLNPSGVPIYAELPASKGNLFTHYVHLQKLQRSVFI